MTLKQVKAALNKVPEGNSGTDVEVNDTMDDEEETCAIESIEYVHRQCLTNGEPPDIKILFRFDR